MLILLEGADCSGKSTLADKIAKRIADHDDFCDSEAACASVDARVARLHSGPPTLHVLREYEGRLDWYRPGSPEGRHVVADRWHLGELIYGPLLRGRSRLDPAMLLHVDLFLRSRGALVVHVDPGWEVIERRLRERGDELVSVDQVRQAHAAYVKLADRYAPVMVKVDGTEDNLLAKDITGVIGLAQFTEHVTTPLASFMTYVGGPSPDVLLLGEMRGHNPEEAELSPAFVPFESTSGHYLLTSIVESSDWQDVDIGIANACEEDVPALWKTLGEPRVVALGMNAYFKTRYESDLRCGAAPHPQFVRRVHHAHRSAYAGVILEAAESHGDLRLWRP